MTNKLLINENPLVILPSLAKEIGLNEAIVLQQIQYWINVPAGGKNIDGVKWIWNSVDEWQKQFPFWSADTVKRTLRKLRERGFLRVRQVNKSTWDRTNFYTIDYKKLDKHIATTDKGRLPQSIQADCPSLDEGRLPLSSYTETTSEITTETKGCLDAFIEFYAKYPVKKNKAGAMKAFNKLSLSDRITATDGIDAYVATVGGKKYICHPATYLNNARWEDGEAAKADADDYSWAEPRPKLNNSIDGVFEKC